MHYVRRIRKLQKTSPSRVVGSIRMMVGVIVAMTGVMKYAVPALNEAWAGQLQAAGLPFFELTYWTVPAVEILVGSALAVGLLARAAAFVVANIMVVATYVHITVDDPGVFPLQPHQPVVPLMVLAMAAVVLWRGAGAWSLDLRAAAEEDVDSSSGSRSSTETHGQVRSRGVASPQSASAPLGAGG